MIFLYKEYGWQLYILMRTATEIRHTLQKEKYFILGLVDAN
jgi:hypothetical protein